MMPVNLPTARDLLHSHARPIIIALLLAGAAAAALASWMLLGGRAAGEAESVSFGGIPSGSAALVYVSQDQGFFAANRISVSVTDYPTGIATTDALLKGEVDIAWAAEFPLVRRAFAGDGISIIAATSRFSDQYLFVRKDGGTGQVADLEGKRLGVPRNTIAEFYLARFLELNGLSILDVSLADVAPSQSVEVIASGGVDGAVSWQPYSSQIRAQLGEEVIAWPVQSSQPGYGVMIARNDWIEAHPELIRRFLGALVRAEDFVLRRPAETKDIVRERVSHDVASIEIFWSENRFVVFLDQSLITAMEDEARWMIGSGLTDRKTIPDFLDYIRADALQAVKPAAVDMIR